MSGIKTIISKAKVIGTNVLRCVIRLVIKLFGLLISYILKLVMWGKSFFLRFGRWLLKKFDKPIKRVIKTYYSITNWLAKKPQNCIARIGSHGLFHIGVLGIVLYFGFTLYYDNLSISPTTVHNIRVSFNPVINSDSFSLYPKRNYAIESCNVLIEDDRVRKLTHGKYTNAIELEYFQNDIVYKDSVEIEITRTPYSHPIECFVVKNDSLIPTNNEFDSIQVVSFVAGMTRKTKMPSPPDETHTHVLICSDDFGKDESSPYYCYRLVFGRNNSEYNGNPVIFRFVLGEEHYKKYDNFNYFSERAISFDQLVPNPDINLGNDIIYKDTTKIKEIFQSGIYIKATDIDKEHKIKKGEYQSSVIAGLLLAFALDIIVQLVIKWRNLIRARKKDDELEMLKDNYYE